MFHSYLLEKTYVTEEEDKKCLLELENQFYGIALDTFKKHFKQWFEPPLLSAMIGGETRIATMFAKWITGKRTGKFYPFRIQYQQQHQRTDNILQTQQQGTICLNILVTVCFF